MLPEVSSCRSMDDVLLGGAGGEPLFKEMQRRDQSLSSKDFRGGLSPRR